MKMKRYGLALVSVAAGEERDRQQDQQFQRLP